MCDQRDILLDYFTFAKIFVILVAPCFFNLYCVKLRGLSNFVLRIAYSRIIKNLNVIVYASTRTKMYLLIHLADTF